MESIYEELFAGSGVSILCESDSSHRPDRFRGMPLPDSHMPFPLLTLLHFHADDHLAEAMSVTFRTYSLPDFLNNLQWWYEMAMGNALACFNRHELRSDPAKKMYESIRKLMEAIYAMCCPQTVKFKRMAQDNWVTPWNRRKPYILTPREFDRPDMVIHWFRREFDRENLRMELWDWLTSALAADSEQMTDRGNRKNLMDFYVHTDLMLGSIYQLSIPLPYE